MTGQHSPIDQTAAFVSQISALAARVAELERFAGLERALRTSRLTLTADGTPTGFVEGSGFGGVIVEGVTHLSLASSGPITVNGETAAVSLGGTYTPGLTALSVGTTGATNEATWAYSGGPGSGDVGRMTLAGRLVWGTAGTRTYPTSTSRIHLPSGFASVAIGTSYESGFWRATTLGVIRIQSGTNAAVHLLRITTGGADPGVANPTATTPHTWAPGDTVVWGTTLPVVRT